MMVNRRLRQELVADARATLQGILRRHRRLWISSYSLLAMIDDDLRRRMTAPPAQGGYGPAIGRGGGAKTGPVHGIATILGAGRTPGVESGWLECSGMVIHGVPVSSERRTSIHHWIGV